MTTLPGAILLSHYPGPIESHLITCKLGGEHIFLLWVSFRRNWNRRRHYTRDYVVSLSEPGFLSLAFGSATHSTSHWELGCSVRGGTMGRQHPLLVNCKDLDKTHVSPPSVWPTTNRLGYSLGHFLWERRQNALTIKLHFLHKIFKCLFR